MCTHCARARTLCLVLFVSLAFGLGSGAFAGSRWNHKRRTLVLSARSFARRYLRLRLIADIRVILAVVVARTYADACKIPAY